jgi:hypothetical protein
MPLRRLTGEELDNNFRALLGGMSARATSSPGCPMPD